jgi:hypothetical protein
MGAEIVVFHRTAPVDTFSAHRTPALLPTYTVSPATAGDPDIELPVGRVHDRFIQLGAAAPPTAL